MRLTIPLTAIALATAVAASGQFVEAGVNLGAVNYAGDLSDGSYRQTDYHGAVGLFARYHHSARLAAKASVTLGSLSGADVRSGNAAQKPRNLSFESSLAEVAVLGEYNLLAFAPRNDQRAALYVTAGLAGFRYNPKAAFNGELVELQPLETEGVSYSRLGLAVPFGAGVKVNLSHRVNVGIEVLLRHTFTDYLDDVSGDYVDLFAQYEANPTAAALAFRAPQAADAALDNPVGTPRGNVDGTDRYLTTVLSIGFNLTSKHGLDFDKKYAIFKTPPPAHGVQPD